MSEGFIDRLRQRVREKTEARRKLSQRSKQVSSIKHSRRIERSYLEHDYSLDRGMEPRVTTEIINGRKEDVYVDGYLECFQGLSYLLMETRKLGEDPLVLDIGAGTTRGISEIEQSPLGKKLRFLATGLAWHDAINDFIGKDRFRATQAERLAGIENNSVSCILGLNSVVYSDQPDLVAKRMDEVLVAGGFIKITGGNDRKLRMHKPNRIRDELVKLGYDTNLVTVPNSYDVLVAVKPGRDDSPSARYLLDQDMNAFQMSQGRNPK